MPYKQIFPSEGSEASRPIFPSSIESFFVDAFSRQELLKLNQLVVFPWLVVSARLALAWYKVAPDSRSSGKGAKSQTQNEFHPEVTSLDLLLV